MAQHPTPDDWRDTLVLPGGTVVRGRLAILDGLRPEHAVSWTRQHHHHRAVQTLWQRRWVRRFPALVGARDGA